MLIIIIIAIIINIVMLVCSILSYMKIVKHLHESNLIMKQSFITIVLCIIFGGIIFITTAKDKYYGCVEQEIKQSINGRHMLFTEIWYRNECHAYWRDEIGLCDRTEEANKYLEQLKINKNEVQKKKK